MDFYSRASCEARLDVDGFYNFVDSISTHAPRVRRDYPPQFLHLNCIDFYSRASCEARLQQVVKFRIDFLISTHAPRVRRDWGRWWTSASTTTFLLTRLV